MRRRTLMLLAPALSMLLRPRADAAGAASVQRRLGVLLFDNAESWGFLAPELRQELATLGWVEGTNLTVDWRFANGDASRLAELAQQMVRSGVDAILTRGTPATRALQLASSSVPIQTGVGDPIGSGFARSYAKPGGNITGLSWGIAEANIKRVELLRAMVPKLARLLVVMKADRSPYVNEMTASIDTAARQFGIATTLALVDGVADLQAALRLDRASGVGAALVFGLGTAIDPKVAAQVALRSRMPAMYEYEFYVDSGGLMSYRLNWENQSRRSAAQLDQIFRGVSPAQIPFELPTRSEFVLNRAAAKSLGLAIPQAVLLRADRVVE